MRVSYGDDAGDAMTSDLWQDHSTINRARCPRCGYDQRGVIATWTEMCPIVGVCSECGLEFQWLDVMRPDRDGPMWCVEFARRRGIFVACFKTATRSIWPWHFWSRLRLRHPLRPRRLAIYVAWMLLPLLFLYVFLQASVAVYVRHQMQKELSQYATNLQTQIAQLNAYLAALQQKDEPALEDGLSVAGAQRQLNFLQAMLTSPPSINHPYLIAILEAVCLPLASSSWGAIQDATGVYPYTAPKDLWAQATELLAGGGVGSLTLRELTRFAFVVLPTATYGWVMLVLVAASFVTLPISMKRAKVRWAHLLRIVAYGVPIPLLALALSALAFAAERLAGGVLDEVAIVVGVASPAALIVLWWWAAIRCYLRMPHAFLTALLLTIIAGLLLPTAAVVIGLLVSG